MTTRTQTLFLGYFFFELYAQLQTMLIVLAQTPELVDIAYDASNFYIVVSMLFFALGCVSLYFDNK